MIIGNEVDMVGSHAPQLTSLTWFGVVSFPSAHSAEARSELYYWH